MTAGPAVRNCVKFASTCVDAVLPRPDGVVILIYHRVGGGSSSEVDLDADVFDRQLDHLASTHRVMTLDRAAAGLRADDGTSGVVITFDDGTSDFADVVVPALHRYGLPATLYVSTRFVDEQVAFPWGAPPLSWQSLRDACSTGLVTVGSHTHSHRLLDRLDAASIDDELDRSVSLIGEHIGSTPVHFAYPKAIGGSPEAEIAVRRRFVSASLAAGRVNRPGRADLHRLWRTPVQRSDGERHFAAKAASRMRLEGELRARFARLTYLGQRR